MTWVALAYFMALGFVAGLVEHYMRASNQRLGITVSLNHSKLVEYRIIAGVGFIGSFFAGRATVDCPGTDPAQAEMIRSLGDSLVVIRNQLKERSKRNIKESSILLNAKPDRSEIDRTLPPGHNDAELRWLDSIIARPLD